MIARRGAKAQGFLQWVSIGSSTFAGENCLGGSTSVSTAGDFGNHMTIIQDAPKADDIVGLFRILSGRHRGRPSHEQKQIQRSQHRSMPYPLIDDEPKLSPMLFAYPTK